METDIIFITFNPFKIHCLPCLSEKVVNVAGVNYIDVYQGEESAQEFDGFLGFYDWLINGDSKVIGVYLSLADFSEGIAVDVAEFKNVELDEDGLGFYIFFSSDREYLEDLSCSQSFGLNKFYKSQNNKDIAISFGSPPGNI